MNGGQNVEIRLARRRDRGVRLLRSWRRLSGGVDWSSPLPGEVTFDAQLVPGLQVPRLFRPCPARRPSRGGPSYRFLADQRVSSPSALVCALGFRPYLVAGFSWKWSVGDETVSLPDLVI